MLQCFITRIYVSNYGPSMNKFCLKNAGFLLLIQWKKNPWMCLNIENNPSSCSGEQFKHGSTIFSKHRTTIQVLQIIFLASCQKSQRFGLICLLIWFLDLCQYNMWCQNDPRLEIIHEFPSLIFSPNVIKKLFFREWIKWDGAFSLIPFKCWTFKLCFCVKCVYPSFNDGVFSMPFCYFFDNGIVNFLIMIKF